MNLPKGTCQRLLYQIISKTCMEICIRCPIKTVHLATSLWNAVLNVSVKVTYSCTEQWSSEVWLQTYVHHTQHAEICQGCNQTVVTTGRCALIFLICSCDVSNFFEFSLSYIVNEVASSIYLYNEISSHIIAWTYRTNSIKYTQMIRKCSCCMALSEK